MERKDWKKKAAVGAVCAAASAGVLVSGAFDTPADLLHDDDDAAVTAHTVILADDDADLPDEEDEERKGSPVRRWMQSLPLAVRALVGVPLWALGWVLTELASLLWTAVLSPLGSSVLSWLLTALLAVGAFDLTAKALFPDIPFRKLLSRRNLLLILDGTLLLGAADTVLPLVWEDYPPIGQWLRLGGTALLLAAGCLSLRRLHCKQEEKPQLTVEQQAMALADTVCPPRKV